MQQTYCLNLDANGPWAHSVPLWAVKTLPRVRDSSGHVWRTAQVLEQQLRNPGAASEAACQAVAACLASLVEWAPLPQIAESRLVGALGSMLLQANHLRVEACQLIKQVG